MCECELHVDRDWFAREMVNRRTFLLASFGFLAGCSSTHSLTELPSPVWPVQDEPYTTPNTQPVVHERETNGLVMSRSAWTRHSPNYSLMRRMDPIRYITVHHDAQLCHLTNQQEVGHRLDAIRRYHRDVRGWGDIGYHYAVDRAGRVWETRPIAWQGAHVKDHNEGNIGVMLLGNFDRQSPSSQQLAALDNHLTTLMRRYNVSLKDVTTHREWAATACPGSSLHQHMVKVRNARRLG